MKNANDWHRVVKSSVQRLAVVSGFAVFCLSAGAASLPAASPAAVGLSPARAEQFRTELQRRVDAGELPGAVLMVVRNGKVAIHQAVGFQDKQANKPMAADSIFRIASMTKPIVSTAIMMLAERGQLLLADPVSRHLPEFKDQKVGVERKTC